LSKKKKTSKNIRNRSTSRRKTGKKKRSEKAERGLGDSKGKKGERNGSKRIRKKDNNLGNGWSLN